MELLLVVLGLILLIIVAIIWVLANSQKEDLGTNDKFTEDVETFSKSFNLEPSTLDLTSKVVKEDVLIKNLNDNIDNNPFGWVSVDNNNFENTNTAIDESDDPTKNETYSQKSKVNTFSLEKTEFTISVLLVDDSPTVLNFTGKMLARRGYEVITKVDGQEAYDYLLDNANPIPDVIISDIEMPNKNGVTLIKELRELSKFKDVPIIIISASAEKHFELMSKGLIQGFLHKPFKEDDLISQLKYVSSES